MFVEASEDVRKGLYLLNTLWTGDADLVYTFKCLVLNVITSRHREGNGGGHVLRGRH